jgi:hypothetical protein
MAPGHWNGHNHGGLHTGTGKYRNSGPYSMNGERPQRHSHRQYTEGKTVKYVGCHKDFCGTVGTILPRVRKPLQRAPRSLIQVQLKDGRKTYFPKDSLVFV